MDILNNMGEIYRINPGELQIDPNIQIARIDVPNNSNGVSVFEPTDEDPESGVLETLKNCGKIIDIGGGHRFWKHKNPPLPHNPNENTHSIFWVDETRDDGGSEITPWIDDSWDKLVRDHFFLDEADKKFDQMQVDDEDLIVYHALGFAKLSDKEKIGDRNIFPKSLQSQVRAHIHAVRSVKDDSSEVEWLGEDHLLKNRHLLSTFLNTAGELAIFRHKESLKRFGKKVIYSQIIKIPGEKENGTYDVNRTMFAFRSWEQALRATLNLYDELLTDWLDLAEEIAGNQIEFAGAQINILQGCLPGFLLIKPSLKDKILGGIDPRINWLVVPFAIAPPQTMLQSGVLLNRLQPKNKD